jgi:hypothetical protein
VDSSVRGAAGGGRGVPRRRRLRAELHFLHDAVAILTQDMDLLLPRDPEQVLQALQALRSAGFVLQAGGEELIPDPVVAAGIVRQSATVHAVRNGESVDLMSWARGMDFTQLWPKRQAFEVRGVSLPVADRLFLEQFREVIEAALEREAQREGRAARSRKPEDESPRG